MAKKIWCYTNSVEGVTGLFEASTLRPVAKPIRHHFYSCEQDNPALQGTHPKLFHSGSDTIDPTETAAQRKAYNAAQDVRETFVVTCGTGSGVGYNSFAPFGSIDHADFDGVVVTAIDVNLGDTWVTFDSKPDHMVKLQVEVGGKNL